MPEVKDYPSHEGFGAAMLAGLMRTEDMILTYDTKDKTKFKVPVFGVPLRDIIEDILAKGPVDVNELYQFVYQYLSNSSDYDVGMFGAMLQPLGWTYKGKGVLVDKDGKPMQGLVVRPVIIADQEYPGKLGSVTNDKGEFSVNGLPPGHFGLRIYGNKEGGEYKDSVDVSLEINYRKLTTEEIEFEPIEVEFQDQMETIVISKIYKTRVYEPYSSITGPTITSQMDFSVEYTGSKKNYYFHDASFTERSDVSSLINFTVDCKTNSPVEASFVFRWTLSQYNWTWEYIDQSMYKDIKVTLNSTPEIEEYDYGEGGYAPYFTWTQDGNTITATMTFKPDDLFSTSDSRRFRLDAHFRGNQVRTSAYGGSTTTDTGYAPSSVVIHLNKSY